MKSRFSQTYIEKGVRFVMGVPPCIIQNQTILVLKPMVTWDNPPFFLRIPHKIMFFFPKVDQNPELTTGWVAHEKKNTCWSNSSVFLLCISIYTPFWGNSWGYTSANSCWSDSFFWGFSWLNCRHGYCEFSCWSSKSAAEWSLPKSA